MGDVSGPGGAAAPAASRGGRGEGPVASGLSNVENPHSLSRGKSVYRLGCGGGQGSWGSSLGWFKSPHSGMTHGGQEG